MCGCFSFARRSFFLLIPQIPLKGWVIKKKQDLNVSVAVRPYFLAGRATLTKLPAVLNITVVVSLKKERTCHFSSTHPYKGICGTKRGKERRAKHCAVAVVSQTHKQQEHGDCRPPYFWSMAAESIAIIASWFEWRSVAAAARAAEPSCCWSMANMALSAGTVPL